MEESYKVIGIFDKGQGKYEHDLYVKAKDEDEAELLAKYYAIENVDRLGVYYGAKGLATKL